MGLRERPESSLALPQERNPLQAADSHKKYYIESKQKETFLMVLNIAMDGPVGAGKSSIADAVAKRLGILHLDTGAMYRAIGLTALEKGVPVQDEQAVTALCQSLSMTVGHAADGQHTLVDGRDVTGFIRTPEVSMGGVYVAKYAGVRAAMVALQRRLAQETPMLVDGRDIGTRVLMNAPVKIFLTASAEERARRRYQEMRNKGMDANFVRCAARFARPRRTGHAPRC